MPLLIRFESTGAAKCSCEDGEMVVCVSTGVIDRATYLLSRAPAKASDVQIKNIAKGTTDPGVDYLNQQSTIQEMTTNFNIS